MNISNTNTMFEVYLLAMSAYEHIMDNEKIHLYYEKATRLLSNNISAGLKAIYYRNKGLVKPHQDLIDEYKKAVLYSKQMSKSCYSCLIQGTCLNNLGLSYLYSDRPEAACKLFSESLRIIESCGYDTSRVHNNIGVSYCLMGDYILARKSFEKSSKLQRNDPFMSKCILGNLAVTLYKTGKKDKASEIIDEIISEYHNANNCVSDTVVYCSALINKGFFCFSKMDYTNAKKYYKESLFHKYRASNEKFYHKRCEMINISSAYEKTQFYEPSDVDLIDNEKNIFFKPYSVVPFAFYVI